MISASLSSSTYSLFGREYLTKVSHFLLDDEEALTVVQRAAKNVPSICLYVDTAPGTFPPPTKPYLQGMADPAETDGYTMLSFYRFSEITVPEDIAQTLNELWKPFKTYGKSL